MIDSHTSRILTACFLTATLGACSHDEEEIGPSEIPYQVTESVEKQFPGFRIKSAERETHNDSVIYEIEGHTSKGKKYELEINADGTIMKIELED